MDFPIFLMAYNPGQESDLTPVDIIEMKDKDDPRRLVLKAGKYLLRINNKKQTKNPGDKTGIREGERLIPDMAC